MSKFVDNEETFDKYNIIKRKPYADYLTSFLNAYTEDGYVLNLNAEWGAGKTTFLKCWYNELKKDHPVIYFDAWKSDFTHDAMTALIDCFHAQLANPISDNKDLIKSFFTKSSHFIRKSIPSLAVGYVKHKTGIDNDESLVEDITGTFGIDIAEKEVGDALKEVLKDVLEQRKKVEGIEEFKTTLSTMAKAVVEVSKKSDNEKQYPVYVLIDELDRCRPNYAIEVIETVKHFFNTKHFVFVIATDTQQLQHSIKAVYGNGFNADLYLSRFFNQTVTLPEPELEEYLRIKLPAVIDLDIEDNLLCIPVIRDIFLFHNIYSLREIDKILSLLLPVKSVSNKVFLIFPLLTLIILNKCFKESYFNFINKGEIPYRISHNDSNKRALNSNNMNISPLRYKNIIQHFEVFLNDCLTSIKDPSDKYVEQVGGSPAAHNMSIYSKAFIVQFHFNKDGQFASHSDYKKLVELSCLFD